VLDLDETLIHTDSLPAPSSLVDQMTVDGIGYLMKRPGLNSFLSYAVEHFEVFIFTYADRAYAEPIVKEIAPFLGDDHLLYRDSCFLRCGEVYKDLDMLGRDMRSVIFVDDNRSTGSFYRRNAITVPPWRGSSIDTILTKSLPEVLERCRMENDVRCTLAILEREIRRWR
jgi:Dullard-like phosphatase family protein